MCWIVEKGNQNTQENGVLLFLRLQERRQVDADDKSALQQWNFIASL